MARENYDLVFSKRQKHKEDLVVIYDFSDFRHQPRLVFSRLYADSSILYFAVIFSVLMNVIAYWYSDKIVLKMAQASPIEKKNAPELYNIVENLSITAGLPMPKVYLIREKQPNAFATGRDSKHAVIAITEGLLEKLDRSELEGVIAHELSHIGNRDMILSTVIVVLVGFISIISDMFLRSAFGAILEAATARTKAKAKRFLC